MPEVIVRLEERACRGHRYVYEEARLLFRSASEHQGIQFLEHPTFGRMLVLDGAVQTTERDEFFYHEMLVHVPMLMHPAPRRVLVVGGGDGGALRRVLEHPVEKVVQVEIDPEVVRLSRTYLPGVSQGAFDDPRVEMVYADAARYVTGTEETFDVILVDSTDPVGPALSLYTEEFYANCRRVLGEGGICATQSGSPLYQQQEVAQAYRLTSTAFPRTFLYLGVVPTYPGVLWSYVIGTDGPGPDNVSSTEVTERARQRGIRGRYFSPDIYPACFRLPEVVKEVIAPSGPPLLFGPSPELEKQAGEGAR